MAGVEEDESLSNANPASPLLLKAERSNPSLSLRRRNVSRTESNLTGIQSPKLGALSICFIAYFNVCGGPWGTEDIISSIGPAPGIAGVFFIAIFWALPLALITAEMSSRFPKNGGYSIWVAEAFGEFWGFQESYWSWVSGVIDNAVYPVLAFHTLKELFGINESYLTKLALSVIFSVPTFFAFESIGSSLLLFFTFILLPFVFFIFHSFLYPVSFSNLLVTNTNSPLTFWNSLLELVPVLYWNFSGLDCVSTYAGEVRSPSKSYVRGLLFALVLVVATYVLTLSAAVVASQTNDWLLWTEGSIVGLVEKSTGMFWGIWAVISSIAANFAMHSSELFEDSWQLAGMAESGLAPACFSHRSRHYHTPIVALTFSLLLICVLVTLDFTQIIIVSNFFSVLSALLEIFAFVKVRLGQDKTDSRERKYYKIPIHSHRLLCFFVSFPVMLGTFILLTSIFDSVFSLMMDTVALGIGLVLYLVLRSSGRLNYQREL